MADHNKPTVDSTYTNFVAELDGRLDDLALMYDPATTTPTNVQLNAIRWSSAAGKFQKWNGTTWNDLSTLYALNISGNAGTVTNGVYITGDQTIAGNKTFTGTVNTSSDVSISLVNVGRGGSNQSTNTTVGANALVANTTGSNNTANGFEALKANTTGVNNTAVGSSALVLNTTGYANTANGGGALSSNTTGNSNTASGFASLYSNTTGFNNTASGANALYSNTTGSSNTASGTNALYFNTTGGSNVASGVNALYSNTTGVNNTASGVNALRSNTTGYANTASGTNALRSNTTGYTNTASGFASLYSNTAGARNTAVGCEASTACTTGDQNAALGYRAGYNSTGNANTFLGCEAGYYTTSAGGNTYVGARAGFHCVGTGNTIIGRYDAVENDMGLRDTDNNAVIATGLGNTVLTYLNASKATYLAESRPGMIPQVSEGKLNIYQTSGNDGINILSDSLYNNVNICSTTTGQHNPIVFFKGTQKNVVGFIQATTTGVALQSVSDYRLKNITGKVTDAEARDFVMALKPKKGTWKVDGSKFVGFLAHEFQVVVPSSVSGDKDAVDAEGKPVMQTMQAASAEVIANLVAHIQNLESRLATLESKS